jgi:dipeptidyl aminopeptidase/acylaminoacyl peptidase
MSIETAPNAGTLERLVTAMARVGSCTAPSFSPDSSQLAFISGLSGVPQVWRQSLAGGWPQAVTALDDQVQGVAWSPTADLLAILVAPGGGMNSQLYTVRPDGTDLRLLSLGERDNNWLLGWTHDGRSIMASSSRRTPEAMDSYLVDADSGEWRLVANNPGTGRLSDVSRDGRWAIIHRVAYRSDSNLVLIDLATGEERLLTPHEPPAQSGGGLFSPDGRTIYLTTDIGRDLAAVARIRLGEDGSPGEIEIIAARDDAEADEIAVTSDGRTAAVLWNVSGRIELHILHLESGEMSKRDDLPNEVAFSPTFSPDGSRFALTVSGADAPADVWFSEEILAGLEQVTFSPHAGVPLEQLTKPELVTFAAHDGERLSGWLYRVPGSSGPGPAVIDYHGGPEGQSQPSFRSLYQALLAVGIAVLSPNVRGSSGFGKRFMNLDNGELRFDAIRDIEACVKYLVDAGIASPGRIGITGGSYGGYMTMAGLAAYPDLFAAGANLFGVVNFQTFFAHTEPWMAAISKTEYGDPDTQAEMLLGLSPITHIDRVRAATLVLHGANDTNVPVVEAEQVVDRLRERGVPVEYILYPDEGHGFLKTANKIHSTLAIVRWFQERLA